MPTNGNSLISLTLALFTVLSQIGFLYILWLWIFMLYIYEPVCLD
uniref:Uncharacterized protein n=1 Tax=Anguilla anguilla TaxID=7936 RepID=A0A0E9WBU7_ANGAN